MRCAAVKKALVRTGDTRSTHYDVPPDEANNEEPKEKQCGGHWRSPLAAGLLLGLG